MKRLGLIVSLLVVVNVFLMGQNFDDVMVKKHLDCEDISYNSALIFERYYNENKLDSAHSILKYWQDKCGLDRKSTRLNSSHLLISYAVFCLKKKNKV